MTVVYVAEYRLFYRALLQKRHTIHESKRFVFDKEMCRGKKKENKRHDKRERREIHESTRTQAQHDSGLVFDREICRGEGKACPVRREDSV